MVVIDEIDKVGANSLKGDVSSTLLELLNPEQSNQFRDSYLDLEFDFSEVIFICTSNSVANMLGPLLDRIEVIQVPAYLPIEKLNIAKKYLVPDLEKEYGFSTQNEQAQFDSFDQENNSGRESDSDSTTAKSPIEQVVEEAEITEES